MHEQDAYFKGYHLQSKPPTSSPRILNQYALGQSVRFKVEMMEKERFKPYEPLKPVIKMNEKKW